jgi:ABC-type phosphate transport system substrate-binding protein
VRASVAIALVLIATTASAPGQTRPEFLLIVNRANPTDSIDRETLADFFLKKVTRWGDDSVVQPVDRDPGAAVRERFSEAVLKRSITAVKSHWQQLIFSGRALPPPELDDDNSVIVYVMSHQGAIGYVSTSAQLHGVKQLDVR